MHNLFGFPASVAGRLFQLWSPRPTGGPVFPVPDGANPDPQVVVYAGSRWACLTCDVLCNSRHRPVCWAGCGQPMEPGHTYKAPTSRSSIPRHLQERTP